MIVNWHKENYELGPAINGNLVEKSMALIIFGQDKLTIRDHN